jgi:hypothetical protein
MKRHTPVNMIKLRYPSSHGIERRSRRGTHLLVAERRNLGLREKKADQKKTRIYQGRISDVIN